MVKIISFISRKGGTGKTTNAINVTTSLFQTGKKVMLVETVTNYTLITLRKREAFKPKEQKQSFDIVGSQDDTVADELIRIKEEGKIDYIIVDSAGKTTNEGIKKL